MKLLGIDYGAKRVGIAISDDGGSIAFAKAVLRTGPDLIKNLSEICQKEKVEGVVMGESKNFAQEENAIMKDVYLLKSEIEEKLKLPVHLEPELMTSMEAQHIQGQNDMNDASAAAIILQSYINRKANDN